MEIRAYVNVRSQLGLKPVDIHREVCETYGEGQMSHKPVCRWVVKFKACQQDLKDVACSCRPPTTTKKVTLRKLPIYVIRVPHTP